VAAIFVKLASVNALVLTFWRLAVASGLLLAVLLFLKRRLGWRSVAAAVPGGIMLCGDMSCYFSAVKLTSIADVSVIGALQPALVMLVAGRLFGEEIRRRDVALTAVAICGVSAVVLGPGLPTSHNLLGDLLAVASLLFWSAYFVISKGARRHLGATEYTFGVTLVATVALLPAVLVAGKSLGHVPAINWLWISLLALIPGSGHLLMNWAHRRIDVSVSSLIGASNPVFAVAAAWAVLGQSLTALQVAGGVCGMLAISAVAGRRRLPATSALEPAPDGPPT
jgi:drug/metabolite transporter (DMT)-like permease